MHVSRILAVVGSVIGIVGLFFKSIDSAGEDLLPALSQASPNFPDGLPTIWGGLDTWAQVVLVILIIVVLGLAFRPVLSEPFDRNSGLAVTAIGIVLAAYAIVKWTDAADSADTLQAGFAQAFQGGAIPQAFEASPSSGFIVLVAGTVIVAVGGLLAVVRGSNR